MKAVRYVLGCCLILAQPTPGISDACSDLQAAIAKSAALRGAMQRETAPFLQSSQLPSHNDAACAAAQRFRDHVVVLAKMFDVKCLNEEQQRRFTASLDASMKEADNNIGLFCH